MANHPFQHQSEEEVALLDDLDSSHAARLVVHNDEVNTFDWVIESFVEVCNHTTAQAEQLSYLIHFKGKATVKTAEKTVLRPMREALTDRGLSAVIED